MSVPALPTHPPIVRIEREVYRDAFTVPSSGCGRRAASALEEDYARCNADFK